MNWVLAYQPRDDPDEFVQYCYSEEEAEDVHPSEVETWYCEFREILVGGRGEASGHCRRGLVQMLLFWLTLGKSDY